MSLPRKAPDNDNGRRVFRMGLSQSTMCALFSVAPDLTVRDLCTMGRERVMALVMSSGSGKA